MKDRLKKIRKHFDLTQQEFANRLNIKRNTIANYEVGRNVPIDAVISLICREFNICEEWLRTGEGDMFEPSPDNVLDALSQEFRLSPADRVAVEKFITLSPSQRNVILDYVLSISRSLDDGRTATAPDMFNQVPKTPEELERLYPPVDMHGSKETG